MLCLKPMNSVVLISRNDFVLVFFFGQMFDFRGHLICRKYATRSILTRNIQLFEKKLKKS